MNAVDKRVKCVHGVTQEKEFVPKGHVVERVAEYDPEHAEQSNPVQATNLAAVVSPEELGGVRVHRTVDQELDQLGLLLGRSRLHDFDADDLLFSLDRVLVFDIGSAIGKLQDLQDYVG